MSYYDFDDHFWSPQTVCSQSAPITNKKITRKSILVGLLGIMCVGVWMLLLSQLFVFATTRDAINRVSTDNPSSNCFLLKREGFQIDCSTTQR